MCFINLEGNIGVRHPPPCALKDDTLEDFLPNANGWCWLSALRGFFLFLHTNHVVIEWMEQDSADPHQSGDQGAWSCPGLKASAPISRDQHSAER